MCHAALENRIRKGRGGQNERLEDGGRVQGSPGFYGNKERLPWWWLRLLSWRGREARS